MLLRVRDALAEDSCGMWAQQASAKVRVMDLCLERWSLFQFEDAKHFVRFCEGLNGVLLV